MNKLLQDRLAEAADHANVLNGDLELAMQATSDPDVLARLREIKDRSYRVALDLGDVFWRIVEGYVEAPQDAPPKRRSWSYASAKRGAPKKRQGKKAAKIVEVYGKGEVISQSDLYDILDWAVHSGETGAAELIRRAIDHEDERDMEAVRKLINRRAAGELPTKRKPTYAELAPRARSLVKQLAAEVGHFPDDSLRLLVDAALAENTHVTLGELIEIVNEQKERR